MLIAGVLTCGGVGAGLIFALARFYPYRSLAGTMLLLTLAGGILLGVLEGLASSIDSIAQYRSAIPFLVILAVLLWSQREARWDEAR